MQIIGIDWLVIGTFQTEFSGNISQIPPGSELRQTFRSEFRSIAAAPAISAVSAAITILNVTAAGDIHDIVLIMDGRL